ncbi:hypothetical protein [Metabacillus fastidiosus]|uniref:hypothetical protein n=1 Tax=Metabacillus fastidiosus TaxID=1458 RepID=UPI003D289309
MRKMRKVIYTLSFVCILIMMSACGNSKTNSNVSENPVENEEVSQQLEIKDLEMVEYGYERDSNGYLQVAAVIKNPNSEHTAKSAHVNWTIVDDNGVVISEPKTVETIRPDETIVVSFPAIQHEEFAEISVELEVKEENWIIEEKPVVTLSDISLSELKVEKDFYKAYVVSGFIENKSEFDVSSYGVGIVFKKNGKIVGGSSTDIHLPLSAGKKYDFKQASSMSFPEMDDYEIYIYNIEI